MTVLQVNALEDVLRTLQRRVDQLERIAASGSVIDYVFDYEMSIGVPGLVVPNAGSYVRLNDLMVFWFVVNIAVSPGSGTLSVSAPFNLSAISMGSWVLNTSTGDTSGAVRMTSGGTDDLFFAYITGGPSGTESLVTHAAPDTLNVGDSLSGFVVAQIHRSRVAP